VDALSRLAYCLAMSSDQPWPSEWLRGVLEVCVLRVLADGQTYGYAIATRLADGGLGVVKGGTLYPLLNRLEAAGLVTAQWRAGDGGPGRKYYLLTDEGHRELERTATRWSRFTAATGAMIAERQHPVRNTTEDPS
jgi:PadR family transcriptional regulator, regulatory protein PadR